jgi:hypothetical protein
MGTLSLHSTDSYLCNNAEADSLPALYTYALLATIFSVIVVGVLAWIASKVGGESAINREAEG